MMSSAQALPLDFYPSGELESAAATNVLSKPHKTYAKVPSVFRRSLDVSSADWNHPSSYFPDFASDSSSKHLRTRSSETPYLMPSNVVHKRSNSEVAVSNAALAVLVQPFKDSPNLPEVTLGEGVSFRPRYKPDGSAVGFVSLKRFEEIRDEYLNGMSKIRRNKALITGEMYIRITSVLNHPSDTRQFTPSFRFWAKKMFSNAQGVLTHDGRPVAAVEQIYTIFIHVHGQCNHGGRDKTATMIYQYYSYIPKDLVSRLIKECPTCGSKRQVEKPDTRVDEEDGCADEDNEQDETISRLSGSDIKILETAPSPRSYNRRRSLSVGDAPMSDPPSAPPYPPRVLPESNKKDYSVLSPTPTKVLEEWLCLLSHYDPVLSREAPSLSESEVGSSLTTENMTTSSVKNGEHGSDVEYHRAYCGGLTDSALDHVNLALPPSAFVKSDIPTMLTTSPTYTGADLADLNSSWTNKAVDITKLGVFGHSASSPRRASHRPPSLNLLHSNFTHHRSQSLPFSEGLLTPLSSLSSAGSDSSSSDYFSLLVSSNVSPMTSPEEAASFNKVADLGLLDISDDGALVPVAFGERGGANNEGDDVLLDSRDEADREEEELFRLLVG